VNEKSAPPAQTPQLETASPRFEAAGERRPGPGAISAELATARNARSPTARAAGSSDAPRAELASARAIAIDRVVRAPGGGIALGGRDDLGPRSLVVWRIGRPGGPTPVALGESRSGRSLDLPQLIVPRTGMLVVVAPEGAGPRSPEASRALWLAAPPLLAPAVARIDGSMDAGPILRVQPRERGGALVIADAEGNALARVPLPSASRAVPLLDVPLAPGSEPHSVAQILDDGRRSDWQRIDSAYRYSPLN
jgi:hypothetical protein